MLTWIGIRARRYAAEVNPWTNVYGLARTFIALSTACTLAFSQATTLFHPAVGITAPPVCGGVRNGWLFCMLAPGHLDLARWIAIAILLVVASGYRPRVTGVLHWWVSLSLQSTAVVIDGGDQTATVLTLLLLPITLTDPRKWHWDPPPDPPALPAGAPLPREKSRLVARSALSAIRVQVAALYLHAALGKLQVEEWTDGTAIYYWLTDPMMGSPDWLKRLMMPLLAHPTVALITWGVFALELALAAGLIVSKPRRRYLLIGGLALHGAIAVVHGLFSFSTVMFAALILYLRPVEQTFDFGWLRLGKRSLNLALGRLAAER